jgi:hypothetical protein
MLGGMIAPTVPPAATVAAAYLRSYPSSTILGWSALPTAAVVAVLDPVIAEKIAQQPSAALPVLPGNQPMTDRENSIRSSEISPS